MNFTNQDFAAAAKTQLDTAIRLAGTASDSFGRLFDLNLKTARTALDEITTQARALADAKDPAAVQAIATKLLQPGLEKSQTYAREVYDSVSAVQTEVTALIESQVTEFHKQFVVGLDALLKNAPAGSETAVSSLKAAVNAANQAYETGLQSWRQAAGAFEPAVAEKTTGKRKAA